MSVRTVSWEVYQKRWRGAQLTQTEVLVYPKANKWAHANTFDVSIFTYCLTFLKITSFLFETLSANTSVLEASQCY
jgi:hypothetical protein